MEVEYVYGDKALTNEWEHMAKLETMIAEFDAQLNILESRISPVMLSPEPEGQMAVPAEAPMHSFHTSLMRLGDQLTRLRIINSRIRC